MNTQTVLIDGQRYWKDTLYWIKQVGSDSVEEQWGRLYSSSNLLSASQYQKTGNTRRVRKTLQTTIIQYHPSQR